MAISIHPVPNPPINTIPPSLLLSRSHIRMSLNHYVRESFLSFLVPLFVCLFVSFLSPEVESSRVQSSMVGSLLMMTLGRRALLLHPLAAGELARRLLDRSVPARGWVAALGRLL